MSGSKECRQFNDRCVQVLVLCLQCIARKKGSASVEGNEWMSVSKHQHLHSLGDFTKMGPRTTSSKICRRALGKGDNALSSLLLCGKCQDNPSRPGQMALWEEDSPLVPLPPLPCKPPPETLACPEVVGCCIMGTTRSGYACVAFSWDKAPCIPQP